MKIEKRPITVLRDRVQKQLSRIELEQEFGFRSISEERKYNKKFGVAVQIYAYLESLEKLIDKYNEA